MFEVETHETIPSFEIKKKYGLPYGYGRTVFGYSVFGDQGDFGYIFGYGLAEIGVHKYGAIDERTGIYQITHIDGKRKNIVFPYYWPKNPRTVAQQANRGKMTNAVAAWQDLTDEQKQNYNRKARGMQMSGYNLYLKNYLLSN